MRFFRLAAISMLVVTLCACSRLFGVHHDDGWQLATSMVQLPQPDAALGSATLSLRPAADGSYELVATGARDLRGVFVELSYDGAKIHPASVEPVGIFVIGTADAQRAVALLAPSASSKSQLGLVLANYDKHAGLTGDGVVARIRMETGVAASPQPVTDRSVSKTAQAVNVINWPLIDYLNNRLTWAYSSLAGDYNQDGEVNISDLATLGLLFGTVGPLAQSGRPAFDFHDVGSVVDGNSDGIINISDITPLASNFGKKIDAFQLFGSDSYLRDYQWQYGTARPAEQAVPIAQFAASDLKGTAGQRKYLDVSTTLALGNYYWLGTQINGMLVGGSAGSHGTEVAGPGIYGVDEHEDFLPQYYDDNFGLRYDAQIPSIDWSGVMHGDCNSDGVVAVSDLTPIGADFGASGGPFSVDSVVWRSDTDNSGTVDIGDIDMIAGRLHVKCDAVTPYYSLPADGPPPDRFTQFGTVITGGHPTLQGGHVYTADVSLPSGSWIWVRPSLGSFIGPACGIQQIP